MLDIQQGDKRGTVMVRRTLLAICLTLGGMWFSCDLRADKPLPKAERLRWFQEAKLGVFFHWGLYSVLGEGEWVMSRKKIRPAEYEKLAARFTPADFRPRDWVDLARRAGARYVIVSAKHHDGFCLFDSQLTGFTVVKATPLKRDVLKELADECRRQGLKFGVAYSILDWHHPDFLPAPIWDRGSPRRARADFAGYLKYLEGQVRELCTRYGKLDLFWWDGGWHHNDESSQKEFARLNALIRELQPHILINNRANVAEDFGTPERPVPATGLVTPDGQPIPWEQGLPLTAGNGSFPPTAWSGFDKSETEFRTRDDLVRTLVDTVSRGGNLLLHVGPQPDGKIQKEFVDSLSALGQWLATHGEAIYGVAPSPLRRLEFWGRATRKADSLYLHVFHWPAEGLFLLPGMTGDLVEANRVKASLLGDPLIPVQPLLRATPEPLYGVRVTGGAPGSGASVLKLRFTRWPRINDAPLRPNAQGALVLSLVHADVHGQRFRLEPAARGLVLSGWSQRSDEVRWEFDLPRAAAYEVVLDYACAADDTGGEIAAAVERNEVRARIQSTGSETLFREQSLGKLSLGAGPQTLTLRAVSFPKGKELLHLRGVTLRPAKP